MYRPGKLNRANDALSHHVEGTLNALLVIKFNWSDKMRVATQLHQEMLTI